MSVDALLTAGAICTAVLAITALVRFVALPLYRVWKRVDAFLEDWFGVPGRPGRKAVPSMPQRVAQLEQRLTNVETQVTPNGGNTNRLGDRIVRVERALSPEPTED